MHHAFVLENGDTVPLSLSRSPHAYRLHGAERTVPVNLHANDDGSAMLTVDGVSERVTIAMHGDDVYIHYRGRNWHLRYAHPLERLAAALRGAEDDALNAPMPGSIVRLDVAVGDTVSAGQKLLVMESMKMETTLAAPRDGTVAELHFAIGQSFERDAVLLSLAPATDESSS